jgi:hypothetical protein
MIETVLVERTMKRRIKEEKEEVRVKPLPDALTKGVNKKRKE